jgi:hypothetical protein
MKLMKQKLLTAAGTLALLVNGSGLLAQEFNQTGDQKIQSLINTISIIDNRLQLSINLGIGAVGYAEVGGVIVDGALDGSKVTEAMLVAYENARDSVLTHDYATATNANQLFIQEHTAAMNSLVNAVDVLGDATSVLMTATSVAAIAEEADTKPEQVALQEMIATDEYSLDASEVDDYNNAIDAVADYAQQAGAFMAAANNSELTTSIDNYAANNNIMIGTYTSITYTQSVDEFVIAWDDSGYGTGWNGYLTEDMKDADDVYGAAAYILQHGSASSNM